MKDMDAAHGTRRQLGRLLVEKGALSEAQLELALAEQQASGRPLGEVAVGLGFASGAVVGNALAEQHGGPLRTEYGFAAGPVRTNGGGLPLQARTVSDELGEGREMAPAVAPIEERFAPEPHPRLEEKPPTDALVEAHSPPLVEVAPLDELASPSSDAVTAPPDDTSHHPRTPDSVIVELRAALEEQATVLASTQAELAEAAADISRAAHEREELALAVENQEAELREARLQFSTRLAELDEQLRERTLECNQLLRSIAQLEVELSEGRQEGSGEGQDLEAFEPEPAEADRTTDEAPATVEEPREATDAPKAMEDVAPDERHLLFFPGLGGYSIVERSGPTPTAGGCVDVVDADGVATPFVVMKVGRSPLPNFGGRCAFLARA